jgi:predicted SAM-dependent methyltransferase
MNTKKIQPLMVNVGCGPIGHDDWINVDYGLLAFIHRFSFLEKIAIKLGVLPKSYQLKWPKNLRIHNSRKGLNFLVSDSVDFIFTSHFLEHIKRYEVMHFLRSAKRCLKSGGVLRVVLPDINLVVKKYLENPTSHEKIDEINDHFFGTIVQSTEKPSFIERIKFLFMRGHQWMYTPEYFIDMVVMAGFDKDKIEIQQYKTGKVPNIDVLDYHADHSFFIEITK